MIFLIASGVVVDGSTSQFGDTGIRYAIKRRLDIEAAFSLNSVHPFVNRIWLGSLATAPAARTA